MRLYFLKTFTLLILLFSLGAIGSNLSDDAKNRGINEVCQSYLSQIEKSFNLNGLNITFAHPENPSLLPSLHVSSQRYNNGSSSFSATLMPDGDYCYLSTVVVTSVNNPSCEEITSFKKKESPSLKEITYADGAFTILTPPDNSYQLILTAAGENSCTMTETRMLWPGK